MLIKNILIVVLALVCVAEPFMFGVAKANVSVQAPAQVSNVVIENLVAKEIVSLRAQNAALRREVTQTRDVVIAAKKAMAAYTAYRKSLVERPSGFVVRTERIEKDGNLIRSSIVRTCSGYCP